MWAKILTAPATFDDVVVDPPTEADLGPGDVLLRVTAGAICGSDLPHFAAGFAVANLLPIDGGAVPGLPLHEVVGEVCASRHPSHGVGDVVVGWASRFDGLREYIISDGTMLATFDQRLRPEAAVLIQPLACVIEAVGRLDNVVGAHAAVIGQGPIGLLFSHVLSDFGATTVTGIDQVDRGAQAEAFRVTDSVTAPSSQWAASITDDSRPDIVVEAAGHQAGTLADAISAVAVDGQVYYFGAPDDVAYPVDMVTLFRKNLTLRSGVTRNRRAALSDADRYLARYPELATDYITNVYPVDEAQAAFDLAAVPAVGRIKVALTFS